MKRTLSISTETTHREYLFGDFDGDKVKNIDDPYPFDKNRKEVPSFKDKPERYHEARMLDPTIKWSDLLLNTEKELNKYSPTVKKFIRHNPKATGRVKTVPSALNKLRKTFLIPNPELTKKIKSGEEVPYLTDIGGVRILTNNRKQARSKSKSVGKMWKTDKRGYDNYYDNPKGGVYYAFHHSLYAGKKSDPRRVELQIKSKPMDKLAAETHALYKKGIDMTPYKKKAKKLFDMGF